MTELGAHLTCLTIDGVDAVVESEDAVMEPVHSRVRVPIAGRLFQPGPIHSGFEPEWRNWYTRWTQNPLPARVCGFESRLRHLGLTAALHPALRQVAPPLENSPEKRDRGMESVGGGLYVPIMVEHMFEGEGIPKGLAEMAPGVRLAAILASIDRNQISGHDRVILLRARARQIAHDQAEFYADINSIHEAEGKVIPGEWTSDVTEMVASEIRAALTLTRRSADHHLGLASDLIRHLPRVGQALREGRIDLAKARVIVEETSHLESGNAQRVADAALERAPSQTTGQLGARLRKLVILLDTDGAKTRYDDAVRGPVCHQLGEYGRHGQSSWAQPSCSSRRRRDATDQPAGPSRQVRRRPENHGPDSSRCPPRSPPGQAIRSLPWKSGNRRHPSRSNDPGRAGRGAR